MPRVAITTGSSSGAETPFGLNPPRQSPKSPVRVDLDERAPPTEGLLRLQLAESQAIVTALRRGEVDALVRDAGIILLSDAEKPYVTFFQAMREGGLTLDAQGRFLNCNGRFAELIGATPQELQGKAFIELVALADRARVAEALASGRMAAEDVRVLQKSGIERPVSLSATPLEVGGQHIVCVLIADQTERAIRNAALAESELKYRLLAESATDWVFWIDEAGNFRYSSSASQALTGHAPGDFIEDPGLMRRILHPEDQDQFVLHTQTCALDDSPVGEAEFRIVHADGRIRWIAHSCCRMADAEGRPMGRRGSNRDITEKKILSQALASQNQQLERTVAERTAELVAARDAAEAANRAKSVFLANMSHEMRTPLNGMLGMVDLLLHSSVSEKQADRLGKIAVSGRHLLGIINDVIDLARIEAGRTVPELAEFSPQEAVCTAVGVVADSAAAKGISIEMQVEDLPSRAFGDAKRFVQALVNYLGNAIKFSDDGAIAVRGRIVEQSASDTLVRIEVEDHGIGIPAETLPRLFEPFEQVDNSMTRRFGGAGLGLAITRRLARLMGGTAGAESEPGIGSTFWLTARLGRAELQPVVPATAPGTPVAQETATVFRDQHVLIVEDDPVSAEVVSEMLRFVGLVPEVAADGAQGVALAGSNTYAAILMDMHLPVLDGVQAAQCIRRSPTGKSVPIIALTADAFPEARTHCQAAGMNEFIVKPFEPQVLFSALERWIVAARRCRGAPLPVGGVSRPTNPPP